uniref:Ovule protein n=1 Tax=Steinernema glaseri TaxID=37863 RepID=A0A1I7Z7N4_9BILA
MLCPNEETNMKLLGRGCFETTTNPMHELRDFGGISALNLTKKPFEWPVYINEETKKIDSLSQLSSLTFCSNFFPNDLPQHFAPTKEQIRHF